jgi:hypothetical protein
MLLVEVELAAIQADGTLHSHTKAYTNDEGGFRFTRIPVGDYLLMVSNPSGQSPRERYFWPGGVTRERAQPIRIDGPAHLDGFELKVIR